MSNDWKQDLPSKDDLVEMFNLVHLKPIPVRKSTIPKIESNLVKLESKSNQEQQLSKDNLIKYLIDRETSLAGLKKDYETNYETFLKIIKKFYQEKLINTKIQFKNQILKQQIYFEQELLELLKEYVKDYEQLAPRTKSKQDKFNKEKHVVKQFKNEIKQLINYMKESLLNCLDTLIEAYETCQLLKQIDQTESQITKQYLNIIKTNNVDDDVDVDEDEDEDEDDNNHQNDELKAQSEELSKYKQEMDDLMHILDQIELDYLERKNLFNSKTKFVQKMQKKLKFLEQKYQNLSKKCECLKLESFVFKQLCLEKENTSNQTQFYDQSCSSRSSSTSSLNDSDQTTSSINCNQDTSDDDLDNLDDLDHDKSAQDYNRKLTIINQLIDLHKTKQFTSQTIEHHNDHSSNHSFLFSRRQSSTLDLSDCSTDGDRVIVENCSLKLDRDVSNWFITRQIENMSINKYQIPDGSIIKCGKELRIHTPFQSNKIDFLLAIKKHLIDNDLNLKNLNLKIRTKLVTPDGVVKAVHIQQVPQFYKEIFKYATLIQLM